MRQATGSDRSKPITAALTVEPGHEYWVAGEYGTATRRQTFDGQLQLPTGMHRSGRKRAPQRTAQRRGGKAGRQRKVRQELARTNSAGWYLIAPSGAAGGNGRTISYLQDGNRKIRPYAYHPGVRPLVVGNADPSRERGVSLGFGAESVGAFSGLSAKGRPQFTQQPHSRGLIRVVLFRAKKRIIADIVEELGRQLKFRGIGQADPPRAVRAIVMESVEANMAKAVATLRQKMPRSSENPDTAKPDPRRRGGPLADAFGYRIS